MRSAYWTGAVTRQYIDHGPHLQPDVLFLLLLGREPDSVSACSSRLVPPQGAHAEQSLLLIKGPAMKFDGACTSPPTADSKLGCELAKCHDRTAYQDLALILSHGYANYVKQLWFESIWCSIKISIE